MRVLLTNQALDVRAGTELFVLEIALALRSLGHFPIAYSSRLGQVADIMRTNDIPVAVDPGKLPFPPDVIHGQHHLEVMSALAFFSNTPAIYHCHGALPWQERPPKHPRILRYFTTSENLRERIAMENGIDYSRIEVIKSYVDLNRFRKREKTLPASPKSALVFSRGFASGEAQRPIREACERLKIEVTFAGYDVGEPVTAPEKVLPQYDIVFATGRSAMEAVACGCGLILADGIRSGPLITPDSLEGARNANFCLPLTLGRTTPERIGHALAQYDPVKCNETSEKLRAEIGMEKVMEKLISAYDQVREEFTSLRSSPQEESEAMGNYLRYLNSLVREVEGARPRAELEGLLLTEREKRRRSQATVQHLREKLRIVEKAFRRSPLLRGLGSRIRRQWRALAPPERGEGTK